ncbi:cytidine monophosphate-N-acetylneuraminic acid hydroxylase [Astyanax mexicanus]|uniref:Cytidine monophosphate-N-acetylneuraminic acid hydroxylase n=1 Tax=Astyanax mexicanus TaxID=7994 RepID=A0A8T2MF78_ASTMX|nr:cytidine monophosphate-N-acetylneuraminic acid hydroxylase [Astyanax mexicanus]
MAQVCQTVLSLDASATQNLKEGINFSAGHCFIIYRHQDNFRACRNQCRHQGGLFITDIEDIDRRTVRCTKHNWKLNVATMKYINPPDSFMQDELEVERSADGGLKLLELDPSDPWTADPRPVQELQPGEVMLTYITHACMELKAGGKSMMFDPWLTGPAFARGWWLQHEPPEDAVERMCRADLIYISHMHSDHLSYPTLKLLSEKRPDVPIFVGNTSRPVFWYLDRSGVNLTNINIVPFGIWQNVDKDLRFMILMDGVHPEIDTCLIVEYKGHRILNTVDCTRPNNGRLPRGVDLMMSDFAGGASGFPMTFHQGKYTESWKIEFISRERKKLLHYKAKLVESLQPRVYCPFAGYFTEAHPSDRYIKNINLKNSPVELNALIQKKCPNILTWTPRPGSTLDLAKALTNHRYSSRHLDNCIAQPLMIQNRVGVVRTVVLNGLLWDDLYIGFNNRISRDPDIYHHRFWTHFQSDLPLSAPDWNTFLRDRPTLHPAPSRVLLPPLFSQLWVVCLWWVEKVRHYFW